MVNGRFIYSPFTINYSLLLCLLNDLDDAPALVRGDGAGLDDAHLVADGRALLVVRHELRRAADVAAVLRVLDETVDAHDARLLHLVRRHDADLLRAAAAVRGLVARRVAGLRVHARAQSLRQRLPRLGRLGRVLRGARRHFFFGLFCHHNLNAECGMMNDELDAVLNSALRIHRSSFTWPPAPAAAR